MSINESPPRPRAFVRLGRERGFCHDRGMFHYQSTGRKFLNHFRINLPMAAFFGAAVSLAAADAPRQHLTADFGWRFSKGDVPKAAQPAFDDSAWRKLDLPHDWSIEG